ncbi:unnamed protein product [Parnassius apollo]|uniref:(apollo) hypothetical protein n=1 Tax=Parnassius apollo TaxID=110799 RepID=A0A8S3XWB1_PARAO|nr:unnamed protein product [Parnassius apollo]
MEETQKGTRIEPLPGGRRCVFGAGAGRGSMRAASRARGAARSTSSPSNPSSPPEAWCRLDLLGPSKRHTPLVEHVACVGQNP